MEFKDPKKGVGLAVRVVPFGDLQVISHQRKPRKTHIKNLVGSIERLGFLVPLIVVERDGKHVVIDGQHRYMAARELKLEELPVVVVPESTAIRMMSLNVEKDLNIRERSHVALAIYKEMLEASPDAKESNKDLADAIDHAHYVTLGITYDKAARLAGSSFEPILSKCDDFLKKPLSEAFEIRQTRAESLLEANELVRGIADALKEAGVDNAYVSAQIIGYANPIKGTRKAAGFDDVFPKFIEKLQSLKDDPQKALRAAGE